MTNKRIYIVSGLVPTRTFYIVNLDSIKGIFITPGFIGAIFGYGSVVLNASEQYKKDVGLKDVHIPIEVRNIIFKAMEHKTDRKRKDEYYENPELGIKMHRPVAWKEEQGIGFVTFYFQSIESEGKENAKLEINVTNL